MFIVYYQPLQFTFITCTYMCACMHAWALVCVSIKWNCVYIIYFICLGVEI